MPQDSELLYGGSDLAKPLSQTTLNPRILVVDDADEIRLAIGEILSENGYHVAEAASGTAALQALQRSSYDVVLLDLMMPGIDGVEVMRRMHAASLDLPVIIITAHPSVESAIVAVRTGAHDYLLKPFNAEELLAAVEEAIASRAAEQRRRHALDTITETLTLLQGTTSAKGVASPEPLKPATQSLLEPPDSSHDETVVVCSGHLCLDYDKRQVYFSDEEGVPEELTEGEMAVLNLLMSKPDSVFSCRDLAIQALDYESLSEYEAQSIVRPYIFRLRQKLEQDARHPQLIRTVRGRGYYLALD